MEVETTLSTGVLLDALNDAAASFEPGELPYLALTSKPEHAIRDRWAWALMKRGRRVAREWRERCDLAMLGDDGEAVALVELKASYTHDVRWSMSATKLAEFRARVGGETALASLLRSDADKVLRIAGAGRGFLLLIALHRELAVPPTLVEMVSEGRRPPRERSGAEASLAAYLAPLGPVSEPIPLADGEAFGVPMAVTAWLCGPVSAREKWAPQVAPDPSTANPR